MISHINSRLEAWGRWVQMDRGRGSKGMAVNWGEPGGGGVHQAVAPIRSLDCSRTHDWVMSLPRDSQLLLAEHYCMPHSVVEQARRLGMSLRTLYRRLHDLQADLAAVERDRVPVAAPKPYAASPRTMPRPAIALVGPVRPPRLGGK